MRLFQGSVQLLCRCLRIGPPRRLQQVALRQILLEQLGRNEFGCHLGATISQGGFRVEITIKGRENQGCLMMRRFNRGRGNNAWLAWQLDRMFFLLRTLRTRVDSSDKILSRRQRSRELFNITQPVGTVKAEINRCCADEPSPNMLFIVFYITL